MAGSSRRSLDLTDRLSRLEEGVREIALEIVQGIFAAELARIEAELALGSPIVAPRRRGEQSRGSSAASTKATSAKPSGAQRAGRRRHAVRDQVPPASSATNAAGSRRAERTTLGPSDTPAAGGLSPTPVGRSALPVAVEPTRTLTAIEATASAITDDGTPVPALMPSSADTEAAVPSIGAAAMTAAGPLPERVIDDDSALVTASFGTDEAGTVKWFSQEKAYGFIAGDDGTDVFVHQSAITAGGLRSLTPGQRVRYEEKRSPKGPFAAIVRAAP
jgi:CspA family cold shock protein